MSSKVKRDIPPIRGLSEKDYDELLMKFPSFEKRVVRFSGRYRTIERMIEKRIERIKQNQDEIRELTEELDDKQKRTSAYCDRNVFQSNMPDNQPQKLMCVPAKDLQIIQIKRNLSRVS